MPFYSFSYSLPYIILLCFLILLYLNEIRKVKFFSIKTGRVLGFFTILFFIGLRGHLFTDFVSYYPFYEELPPVFDIEGNTFLNYLFEPGFVVYSSIFKIFYLNYFTWVFINTFVDLLILYIFFKRYNNSSIILCFIVFLGFQGFFVEFNLYRNSKAIVLFLLSLSYLQKKHFIPYLLLNLLGVLFHSSALLYILVYPFLNMKINKLLIWIIFILFNILFLCNFHFTSHLTSYLALLSQLDNINMKLAIYQEESGSYGISLGYIERLFSFVVFTVSYTKLVSKNEMNRIFYNCFLLYYFSFLLFADVAILTERIPLLFIFSYWILYPNTLQVQKGITRSIIYLVLFVFVLTKTLSINSVFCEYDNLIWGIKSFEERYDIIQKMYFN